MKKREREVVQVDGEGEIIPLAHMFVKRADVQSGLIERGGRVPHFDS